MTQRTLSLAWLLGGLLLVLTVARTGHSARNLKSKATIFADLSPEELRVVRSFLWTKKDLKLKPSNAATMAKNSIFLIEMLLPKKHQVLKFLDKRGSRPVREARVVIFFGAQKHPNITEFAVGPLPMPTYMRALPPKSGHNPSWGSRPISSVEYDFLYQTLMEALIPLKHFLQDTKSFWLPNCDEHCLTFTDVSPRGLASGQRRSWFIMQRFVEGYFLHPTGIELLLNHESSDHKEWRVERVWYNGKFYKSIKDLAEKYEEGKVNVVILEDISLKGKPTGNTEEQPLFSSYQPRGDFPTPTWVSGPHLVEPQGPRYQLEGNAVLYGGWSFAFRMRTSTGLQILNLRFGGEQIAYEVSIQEAVALYGGHTPAGMQTKYIDVGWGLGSVNHELAPGIDCPKTATFLDAYHFYDADAPTHYPNALCIFEMPTGVPLRRHFDSNFSGGFNFYAGLEGQVLVVRTTSTVYNYDYLWDFIFHHNGVMEVKMHATGYVHATFFTPEGLRHGTRLHTHLLGNIHTHLVHYRVDLDVAGTKNVFETMGTKLENITNPWSPRHHVVQPVLERTPHHQERQAAFRFGQKLPKFLMFSSQKKNPWGHNRSYRIQLQSMADQVLPPGWQEERAVTWARYPLAVTKYRESELVSSSIYNQNDPWDPPVVFEKFLKNNENIENEDLVAWVTVGFLHIPHSEDIPNTATPGNSVGFLLRPFNFFTEDPSLASQGTLIVYPQAEGPNDIHRWAPDTLEGCWKASPFKYNGTYMPVY